MKMRGMPSIASPELSFTTNRSWLKLHMNPFPVGGIILAQHQLLEVVVIVDNINIIPAPAQSLITIIIKMIIMTNIIGDRLCTNNLEALADIIVALVTIITTIVTMTITEWITIVEEVAEVQAEDITILLVGLSHHHHQFANTHGGEAAAVGTTTTMII
jgi:hypothetical protein